MDIEVVSSIWHLVCFVFGLFIMWCIMTATEDKPVLTQAQTFEAIDRIVCHCEGNYDKCRAMLDEFYRYMNDECDAAYVSKDLLEIIVGVQNFNKG